MLVLDDAVAHLRCDALASVYPPDLRTVLPAIALARFAQHPLRETAALWKRTPGGRNALLEVVLSSEDETPVEMVETELEKVLCMEVADAGVSLQESATYVDGFCKSWREMLHSSVPLPSWSWSAEGPGVTTSGGASCGLSP